MSRCDAMRLERKNTDAASRRGHEGYGGKVEEAHLDFRPAWSGAQLSGLHRAEPRACSASRQIRLDGATCSFRRRSCAAPALRIARLFHGQDPVVETSSGRAAVRFRSHALSGVRDLAKSREGGLAYLATRSRRGASLRDLLLGSELVDPEECMTRNAARQMLCVLRSLGLAPRLSTWESR